VTTRSGRQMPATAAAPSSLATTSALAAMAAAEQGAEPDSRPGGGATGPPRPVYIPDNLSTISRVSASSNNATDELLKTISAVDDDQLDELVRERAQKPRTVPPRKSGTKKASALATQPRISRVSPSQVDSLFLQEVRQVRDPGTGSHISGGGAGHGHGGGSGVGAFPAPTSYPESSASHDHRRGDQGPYGLPDLPNLPNLRDLHDLPDLRGPPLNADDDGENMDYDAVLRMTRFSGPGDQQQQQAQYQPAAHEEELAQRVRRLSLDDHPAPPNQDGGFFGEALAQQQHQPQHPSVGPAIKDPCDQRDGRDGGNGGGGVGYSGFGLGPDAERALQKGAFFGGNDEGQGMPAGMAQDHLGQDEGYLSGQGNQMGQGEPIDRSGQNPGRGPAFSPADSQFLRESWRASTPPPPPPTIGAEGVFPGGADFADSGEALSRNLAARLGGGVAGLAAGAEQLREEYAREFVPEPKVRRPQGAGGMMLDETRINSLYEDPPVHLLSRNQMIQQIDYYRDRCTEMAGRGVNVGCPGPEEMVGVGTCPLDHLQGLLGRFQQAFDLATRREKADSWVNEKIDRYVFYASIAEAIDGQAGPFFNLKGTTADVKELMQQHRGNFYRWYAQQMREEEADPSKAIQAALKQFYAMHLVQKGALMMVGKVLGFNKKKDAAALPSSATATPAHGAQQPPASQFYYPPPPQFFGHPQQVQQFQQFQQAQHPQQNQGFYGGAPSPYAGMPAPSPAGPFQQQQQMPFQGPGQPQQQQQPYQHYAYAPPGQHPAQAAAPYYSPYYLPYPPPAYAQPPQPSQTSQTSQHTQQPQPPNPQQPGQQYFQQPPSQQNPAMNAQMPGAALGPQAAPAPPKRKITRRA